MILFELLHLIPNHVRCYFIVMDIIIYNSFFSLLEIALGTPCVVKMTSNQTILHPPPNISSMSSDNVKER